MGKATSLKSDLAFLACVGGSLVSLLLGVPLVAVGLAALSVIPWFFGRRASVRQGNARLVAEPTTAKGFDRSRVASAIALSWLVPGLGDLYVGLPRRHALILILTYLAIAIPVWTSIMPIALGVPLAMLVWIWGQDG